MLLVGESLLPYESALQSTDPLVVRVRPWHPTKELPHLSGTSHQPVFLGDGNFAASPMKAASGGIREVVGES